MSDLYDWQIDALEAWRAADRRGVVQATTGAGKTRLAIAAIEDVRSIDAGTCIAVVVPTKVLARQWHRALVRDLGVRSEQVGQYHSGAKGEQWSGQSLVVFVIDSARVGLAEVCGRWVLRNPDAPVLLIVDECHRSGSDRNARIFDVPVRFTLGLSATPERLDGRHETHVYPALGDEVFRYGLQDALDDAVVADIRAVNFYVRFNASERERWTELEGEVVRLGNVLLHTGNSLGRADLARQAKTRPSAQRLLGLLAEQESIIDGCANRDTCMLEILDWIERSNERTIVFNESIDKAIWIWNELSLRDVPVAIEHSELDDDVRVRALDDFKTGKARVLIAVRSLDEGIDVPDATVAVIVTGGRTLRQRLQRVGRVARRSDGKQEALVIAVLALSSPEAVLVGGRDAAIFGEARVFHHEWPRTRVAEALAADVSTMDIAQLQVERGSALVAFLGLADDEPSPIVPTARPIAAALVVARQALRASDWSRYTEAVNTARVLLVEAGGDVEVGWEVEDNMPTGVPSLRRFPGIERRALHELFAIRGLLRRDLKANYTRALRRLREANRELTRAVETEEQLQHDLSQLQYDLEAARRNLEERDAREHVSVCVEDAEALARSPRLEEIVPFINACERWRRRPRVNNAREYRALRSRMEAAQDGFLRAMITAAETGAGITDSAACLQLEVARRAWRSVGKGSESAERKELRTRLRKAVRTTLLALVEEAEMMHGTTGTGAGSEFERLVELWQQAGGAFDESMQRSLGPRFAAALEQALGRRPSLQVIRPFDNER